MKSLIRFVVMAVVMTLLVGAVGLPVHAQGSTPNMCFDLKADDCTLITNGFGGLVKVSSANFEWHLLAKVAGTDQDGDVSVDGKGSFVAPPMPTDAGSGGGSPMTAAMGALSTLQFQNSLSAKATMSGKDQSISLEFRIVDGILYFMSDKLTAGKWKSLKLNEAISSAMSMASSMGGAGGKGGIAANNPMAGMMSNPELISALMQAPSIPGVIK